ncbi:MAG: hypothetical protein KDC98_25935, partial [Planctomycetes bacterium]|nr:hypothetical protein [Planctomycetota bacterium]
MPSTTITLRPPHPFELRLCLFGHGWIDLAPHDYDESRQSFSTALRLGSHVVDAELRPAARGSLELRLVSRRKLGARALDEAR